jgi:hypothetical protein
MLMFLTTLLVWTYGIVKKTATSGVPFSEEPPASSVKDMPGKGVHCAAGPKGSPAQHRPVELRPKPRRAEAR